MTKYGEHEIAGVIRYYEMQLAKQSRRLRNLDARGAADEARAAAKQTTLKCNIVLDALRLLEENHER